LYYKFDSAYQLGINSCKNGRAFECAKTAYLNLVKFNAETKYKEKADEMLARVEQDLQNFTK
jgi:outer membrane protein assembly factor BamD